MRNLLIIRRVVGASMEPTFKAGQLVVASSLLKPKVGRVIIAESDGKEVIKRVISIDDDKLKLSGDNPHAAHNKTVPIKDFVATKLF